MELPKAIKRQWISNGNPLAQLIGGLRASGFPGMTRKLLCEYITILQWGNGERSKLAYRPKGIDPRVVGGHWPQAIASSCAISSKLRFGDLYGALAWPERRQRHDELEFAPGCTSTRLKPHARPCILIFIQASMPPITDSLSVVV